MSIKALAVAILQRNYLVNQRETKSFLGGKLEGAKKHPRKLSSCPPHLHFNPLKTPRTKIKTSGSQDDASHEPSWQYDFCSAHADFNNWKGSCPCSLDDCLFSKVLDAGGDIGKLRGLPIGQGVTTDHVIDECLESGEPVEDIFKNPLWLICMALHIQKEPSWQNT